jgi:hypothetical protein
MNPQRPAFFLDAIYLVDEIRGTKLTLEQFHFGLGIVAENPL